MLTRFTKQSIIIALLVCGQIAAFGQTVIWPTADTNTVNASQFKGAGSLVRYTTASTNIRTWGIPSTYTGWVTHGLTSSDAAKRDSAVWTWSGNGTQGGGLYGGNTATQTPTVGNGMVVFNSDFLDTRGVADGTGPAPSLHSGELISPVMNATGYTNPTLTFNQYYRKFASNCSVAYSQDTGRTWSTPFPLNAEITANNATDNSSVAATLKSVRLQGAVGNASFRVKFIFDGDAYFWCVDDVKLVNAAAIVNDLDVKTAATYALPPSYITPTTQIEPIRFMADATNNGIAAAANAKLNVTIWRITRNASGAETGRTEVHNTTYNYPSFPAGATIQKKILPAGFTPPATPAEYLGRYKVTSDSVDQVATNDSIAFSFFIADTVNYNQITNPQPGFANGANTNYSKDNTNSTGTGTAFLTFAQSFWPTATEPRALRIGNFYRFVKKNNTITRITALIAPFSARGNSLRASLYKWVDANNDGTIQTTERQLLAISDTLLPSTITDVATWYNFNIKGILDDKPPVSADTTNYLAMIEVNNTVDVTSRVYWGFTSQEYESMHYLTDSLGGYRPTMIYGRTSDSDWEAGNFVNRVPVVRLFAYPFRVNTDDILSDNNSVEIFPNPTGADYVTVKVELEKARQAGIRITSIDGRVISEQDAGNIQKGAIRVNVSALANGTYFVQLLTEDGVKTKKLVINR